MITLLFLYSFWYSWLQSFNIKYDWTQRKRKKQSRTILKHNRILCTYTAQDVRKDLLFGLSLNGTGPCITPIIYTYNDSNACSGSGAVTSSRGALQHSLHNLCCDWQASINLGSLCSIIISPPTQLDSTQQASWHCAASQKKFKVSRQGCWLPHQWIFEGSACQCNAEHALTDKHMWPQIGPCVQRMWI